MRFRTAEKLRDPVGVALYPIDDAGHFIFADQPESFLDALRAALGAAG